MMKMTAAAAYSTTTVLTAPLMLDTAYRLERSYARGARFNALRGLLAAARTLAPSTESQIKPVTNRTGMAGGLRASCHLNYGRFAVTLPSSGTLINVALATTWTYCRKPRNGNAVLQDGARKNCRAFLGKRRETVVTSRESSYAKWNAGSRHRVWFRKEAPRAPGFFDPAVENARRRTTSL